MGKLKGLKEQYQLIEHLRINILMDGKRLEEARAELLEMKHEYNKQCSGPGFGEEALCLECEEEFMFLGEPICPMCEVK